LCTVMSRTSTGTPARLLGQRPTPRWRRRGTCLPLCQRVSFERAMWPERVSSSSSSRTGSRGKRGRCGGPPPFGAEAEHGFGAWVPAGYNARWTSKKCRRPKIAQWRRAGPGPTGPPCAPLCPGWRLRQVPATAAAYGSKADVDGELATVLAPGVKVEPGPHGRCGGRPSSRPGAGTMRVAGSAPGPELYVFPLDFLAE